MDISDIVMLEAIVKHGSLSKASEVLYLSQPTLSKRLGRLEYVLGTTLFFRDSSGLTPTAHTEFIINNSQSLRTQMHSIQRHIELMNALELGELKLGVGPIVEQLYFPYTLLEISKSPTSKLNVSIRTETDEDLKLLLLDGEVDVAVGPFEQSSDSEKFVIFPVASQPLVIAARAEHPFITSQENGEKLSPVDIFNYPLIAPHTPKYMSEQFDMLNHIDSSRVICDNYSVIKEVLKASDHISIGPSAVFSGEVKENSLALIPLPNPVSWYAACITLSQNACLPFIKRVIEVFRQYELPTVDDS